MNLSPEQLLHKYSRESNSLEVSKLLLEHKFSHEPDQGYDKAIMIALEHKNNEIVDIIIFKLLELDDLVDFRYILDSAAIFGNLEVVKKMAPLVKNYNDALFNASSEGHVDIVKYLLTLGMNVENIDIDFFISSSIENGHAEVTDILQSLRK